MANEKDQEITELDRKPIVFVAVKELERVLSRASQATFKQAVLGSTEKEFQGWRLDGVHRELTSVDPPKTRKYPYDSGLRDLLPWWDDMNNNAEWPVSLN